MTVSGGGIPFMWHVQRTGHEFRFDGGTWAATCDCGRVFYPIGCRKELLIPLGRYEIRVTYAGRPPKAFRRRS